MLLSAGIIVVRWVEGRWLFLLLRAYNRWDFPKGQVEAGETPLQTALRETEEEAGLRDLSLRWGRDFVETAPYNNNRKKARYYLAETAEAAVTFGVNPELGRPEHHEYRWLAGEELRALIPERLRPVVRWAAAQLRAGKSA